MLIIILVSFISLSILGRKLGTYGSILVSNVLILISTLWLSVIVLSILNTEWELNQNVLYLSIIKLDISITLDKYSIILSLSIILVSLSVHIYSVTYIKQDVNKIWFISLLSLFTISILWLTLSNNLLQLFIGWELIGITSYLLIGFWSNRTSATSSALKAFIINRIGDIILIYLISLLVINYNELNYKSLSIESLLSWITLILLLSSIAKSSQLGLHIWLPTSIEGPTPVSALIHAATLVTAGVYLLVKLSSIIQFSMYIGLLGALTVLIAGLIGSIQSDIKRLIAYSTMSQIGYIYIALGIENYSIAISHIINHAFFKALLFLCAGSVIHSILDQDIRKYGSLIYNIPLSYIITLFGSLSLIALPSLTGYYSKDIIITLAYGNYDYINLIIYVSSLLGALLTGFYSIRLLKLTYWSMIINKPLSVNEISWLDIISITLLFVISLSLGYLSSDWSININIDSEYILNQFDKLLPLIITILGSIFQLLLPKDLKLLVQGLWFDNIIQYFSIKVITLNKLLINKFDKGLLEQLGPNGLSLININLSTNISTVSYYALIQILTIIVILIMFMNGVIVLNIVILIILL